MVYLCCKSGIRKTPYGFIGNDTDLLIPFPFSTFVRLFSSDFDISPPATGKTARIFLVIPFLEKYGKIHAAAS